MEGSKKTLLALGLIVVIVIAIVLIVRNRGGTDKMPAAIMAQPVELVDVKTGAVVTSTRGDVANMAIDPQTGYLKGKSGDLASPMNCAACKAIIPMPPVAPGVESTSGLSTLDEALKNYVCPKCGKKAHTL